MDLHCSLRRCPIFNRLDLGGIHVNAMAVRNFKKFFRRRGKFVRQPHDDKKVFRKVKEDKKGKVDRKCFKCGDPNHFISDCPKHAYTDQKAFVGGSWSDSDEDEDLKKYEICLMAHDSNELLSDILYYSSSSLDDETLQNEYNKLHNDKKGLEFTEHKASTSGVKTGKSGKNSAAKVIVVPTQPGPSERDPANVDEGIRATVCLKVQLEPDEWIKDSGYTRHMMGNKSLFSTYKAIDGVSRNKARLVAQGYNQQEGIDFDETYAPIARLESIRFLLAYACANYFKLFQMDVKSAFLNGFINEVFVSQPPGFVDFEKPNHVYKLKKALYGLKQAPKGWYDRLKAFLLEHKYTMGLVDNTLFTKKLDSHIIIVQIYVDDIIFGSTYQELCNDFFKIMHDEFEISMMGELNFFLGLQIKQLEDGIFFNQSKYIKEMLKKFSLEDSEPIKTPMSSETKLTKDEDEESVDNIKYHGMIGSLPYLTTSQSDIMFSVCLCARFQEDLKTSHLEAMKRIFRYIKGTTHLGLWYPKGTGVETKVYTDSDHARDCRSQEY
ncbi:retrovirus-related pol polyprotein from transposon TNT 1-94 [Tanacetum coccineum]